MTSSANRAPSAVSGVASRIERSHKRQADLRALVLELRAVSLDFLALPATNDLLIGAPLGRPHPASTSRQREASQGRSGLNWRLLRAWGMFALLFTPSRLSTAYRDLKDNEPSD
jgi:hypothetical protein